MKKKAVRQKAVRQPTTQEHINALWERVENLAGVIAKNHKLMVRRVKALEKEQHAIDRAMWDVIKRHEEVHHPHLINTPEAVLEKAMAAQALLDQFNDEAGEDHEEPS